MTAVWTRVRAELRRRWRTTVVLVVLAANARAALPARAAVDVRPAAALRSE